MRPWLDLVPVIITTVITLSPRLRIVKVCCPSLPRGVSSLATESTAFRRWARSGIL